MSKRKFEGFTWEYMDCIKSIHFLELLVGLRINSAVQLSQEIDSECDAEFCSNCQSHRDHCECINPNMWDWDDYKDR